LSRLAAPVGRGTLVADASAVVALLVDQGAAGRWVAGQLAGHVLTAPELLPFEVANALRRQVRARLLHVDRATAAHRAMVDAHVELWPYAPLSRRVWALRDQLSSYDAAYVAVAELVDAPLITLDARLARGVSADCEIRVFATR
jgi:predicted nucleic acid-binding protein